MRAGCHSSLYLKLYFRPRPNPPARISNMKSGIAVLGTAGQQDRTALPGVGQGHLKRSRSNLDRTITLFLYVVRPPGPGSKFHRAVSRFAGIRR
jgi:hypothetical protein